MYKAFLLLTPYTVFCPHPDNPFFPANPFLLFLSFGLFYDPLSLIRTVFVTMGFGIIPLSLQGRLVGGYMTEWPPAQDSSIANSSPGRYKARNPGTQEPPKHDYCWLVYAQYRQQLLLWLIRLWHVPDWVFPHLQSTQYEGVLIFYSPSSHLPALTFIPQPLPEYSLGFS